MKKFIHEFRWGVLALLLMSCIVSFLIIAVVIGRISS